MKKLANRVAIVTGAAQGIGRAYAIEFANQGAKVVIADILDGQDVAREIRNGGGIALDIPTDVSDQASVKNLVDQVVKTLGRIDILVNNAAIFVATYPMREFDQITLAEWDKVMKVNINGTFLCCKEVVPVMRRQKYGRVINISSSVFWRGLPGFLHYSTSKAAIIGLTRSMAHEVGKDGITVNSIAPGYTQSEGVIRVQDEGLGQDPNDVASGQAIARPQVPEDLLGAAVFFASDDGAFVTGQTLVVDGGLAMN